MGAPSTDGIWVINLVDQSTSHIVTLPAEHPAWSPTGDVIAFAGGVNREIFTVRPDGTELKQLTNFGPSNDNSTWAVDPAWSPDGSKLVFTHGQSTERVWVVAPDGSGAHTLVDADSRDREPTF